MSDLVVALYAAAEKRSIPFTIENSIPVDEFNKIQPIKMEERTIQIGNSMIIICELDHFL